MLRPHEASRRRCQSAAGIGRRNRFVITSWWWVRRPAPELVFVVSLSLARPASAGNDDDF